MRYIDFKKNIHQTDNTALFFYGEEDFFREEAVSLLKSAFLTMEGIDFDVFDAKTVPISTVVATLSTPPFLNKQRLVILKEYYPTAKEYQSSGLATFAKTEQSFAVLAIINEKPCDALLKDGFFLPIDCAKEGATYLTFFAQERLAERGVKVSSSVASALADACAGSMTRLSVEIEKIAAFGANGEPITGKDVENLVHRDVEMQVFDLTNALAAKNAEKSLRLLDALLRNNEKPQMIFVAVYNAFRRMLHVSLSQKTDGQLAADLGVKSEYAIKKSRQAAKGFTKKNLKRICDRFCECDSKMKSGGLVADGVLYDCIYYVLSL